MNAIRLAIVAICLLWSFASLGDWEYTTYGMSADQIVAASDGKARKLSRAEIEGKGTQTSTALAASTHKTGPFTFSVTFFADKGDSRLTTVRLELQTKDKFQTRAQVAELRNALIGKYGQPTDEQLEKGEFFTTKQWNWIFS